MEGEAESVAGGGQSVNYAGESTESGVPGTSDAARRLGNGMLTGVGLWRIRTGTWTINNGVECGE